MIIYTLLYYTCIFIRCQRILDAQGIYRKSRPKGRPALHKSAKKGAIVKTAPYEPILASLGLRTHELLSPQEMDKVEQVFVEGIVQGFGF